MRVSGFRKDLESCVPSLSAALYESQIDIARDKARDEVLFPET